MKTLKHFLVGFHKYAITQFCDHKRTSVCQKLFLKAISSFKLAKIYEEGAQMLPKLWLRSAPECSK